MRAARERPPSARWRSILAERSDLTCCEPEKRSDIMDLGSNVIRRYI